MKLKISDIEPNREQPRKSFDEDGLIELSESIKQFGSPAADSGTEKG